MLVVVAIQAQQFPIRAVFRVIVVVMVLVMDRQLAQALSRKLTGATPAYPWVHLQSLFTVALFALGVRYVRFAGHDCGPTEEAIRLKSAQYDLTVSLPARRRHFARHHGRR